MEIPAAVLFFRTFQHCLIKRPEDPTWRGAGYVGLRMYQQPEKADSPFNTQIIIATAQGIILNKDTNLLSNIELGKGWAKYLLKRIGFVKRKLTTTAKGNVENFYLLKEEFLLEVKNVVYVDKIPKDLIIYFDQISINYVPVTSWTME